jgi:hypothetical protein
MSLKATLLSFLEMVAVVFPTFLSLSLKRNQTGERILWNRRVFGFGADIPGNDLAGEITISLQEAYTGTERIIDLGVKRLS